jgi:DNA-binding FadR family transcriptional regulator
MAAMDGNGTMLPIQARGDAGTVQRLLERDLLADRWRDGERLPTERELCGQFGVARNTVRRALDALEAQHLIVRHVGRGTFKAAPPIARAVDGMRDASINAIGPADVTECRLLFEPELAALVVARASGADLDRMTECLAGLEAAEDVAGFELLDNALHDAIAVATHNQAAIAMTRALARVRQDSEWGTLKALGMTPERKAALNAQHRAIGAAFRDRDRLAARRLLREHILFVQSYMFG